MQRLLEAFPLDPVADAERQLADDPGVVHMADRGMVQPAECLSLSHEPRTNGGILIEVDPEADPPLENQVVCFEEDLFGRCGHRPLEPIAMPQGLVGPLEVA
jgi:hypothetical protein